MIKILIYFHIFSLKCGSFHGVERIVDIFAHSFDVFARLNQLFCTINFLRVFAQQKNQVASLNFARFAIDFHCSTCLNKLFQKINK